MKTDGFHPGAAVSGPVRVPGSKSIAQRALAAAAFAHGTTELVGLPASDDVVHALRCARAAGARFPSEGRADDLFVTALMRRRGHGRLAGVPPLSGEGARPWCTANVGESGTTARLFTALLALARPAGSGAELIPAGSLERRRSPALFATLRALGAGIEHALDAPDGWPVLLTSPPRAEAAFLSRPSSSQEVSALLLALASHPGSSRLDVEGDLPSGPYVELTVQLLARFGAAVEELPRADLPAGHRRFIVGGPLRAPEEPILVEPDASAAAVALAAGCLSGGECWVEGLGEGTAQPDRACLPLLTAFGCAAAAEPTRWIAAGRPTRGVEFDLRHAPDLAPVAVALGADVALRGLGPTRLTGLGTLPGKESSRIAVLAGGLEALGLTVHADGESLQLEAVDALRGARSEVVVDPMRDHRMAFAFALLSLAHPGVRVAEPRCVSKSWPTFWDDLAAAGARRY